MNNKEPNRDIKAKKTPHLTTTNPTSHSSG